MRELYDAVIVGGGPAGLASAIYLARAQYNVLVVEKETIGGQITITSEVVNYPGIPKTSGKQLTDSMKKQAQNFGAEFLQATVTDLQLDDDKKYVVTDKGKIQTLGVVLATGASPRKAGFVGEEDFRGRGVAYCATCDGEFFTGKDIYVVGGGFAAAEEAIFLTRYGNKVTIFVRGDQFTCAGSIVDHVMEHPKIEVKFNAEVIEVGGNPLLQYIVTKENGEEHRYEGENGSNIGVFVFAGYEPATALFKDKVEIDDRGYLVTNERKETSKAGVYGAGDVCEKELRQVVTAVSDGAIAATTMEKYLMNMYTKLGLKKEEKPVVHQEDADVDVSAEANETDGFITDAMKQELAPVFARFERKVKICVYLDNSTLAKEMIGFSEEVKTLSDQIIIERFDKREDGKITPSMVLCDETGKELGVEFHAIPGGHEFNSFIIALYNAGSKGQPLDEDIKKRIKNLKPLHIKVVVSLSCTMCPEVVMATQRIALENDGITTEMFDIAHFEHLKDEYQIMSVPCVIVNDKSVFFGKKGIADWVDILEKIEN